MIKNIDQIPERKPHFYELDLMRFVAAFLVMVYHFTFGATHLMGAPVFGIEKVTKYGFLGVDIFFMISGYVVLMSSMYKSPKEFLISRVSRLYPAYWLVVILYFIFLSFVSFGTTAIPTVSVKLLPYNLTMLQSFFGKQDINPVFWTLAYEISFYFLILLISALKLWKNLLPILVIWLLYSFITDMHSTTPFAYLLIPKFSACFISGMLFYLLRIKYTQAWKIYLLLPFCFFLNIKNDLALRDETNYFLHAPADHKDYAIIIAIALFYLFFILSSLGKFKNLNFKFFIQLGALTYPLYLLHPAGCVTFVLLAGKVNKYLLFVASIVFFMLLAYLVNRFYEKKLQRFLKTKLNALLNNLS